MANAAETAVKLQAAIAKHWPGVRAQVAKEWAMYLAFARRQLAAYRARNSIKEAMSVQEPSASTLVDTSAGTPPVGVEAAQLPTAAIKAKAAAAPLTAAVPGVRPKLLLDVWIALFFMLIFAGATLAATYIALLEPQMVADGLKSLNPDLKKQSLEQLFPENIRYAAAGLFGGFGLLALAVIYGLWQVRFRAWTWAIYLMALSMCLLAPVPLAVLVLGSLLKADVVRLYARDLTKG